MFWNGMCKDVETAPRDRICAAEIWCELFGFAPGNMKRQDAREINDVLRAAKDWKEFKSTGSFGYCGVQKGYCKIHE